jgi:ParB-like nuclease domain
MPKKQATTATADPGFLCEDWPLEKVRPTLAAYNPRTITERMLEALKAGIEQYGCILPVVINQRTDRMVGGHQRFRAVDALGQETIPVHLIDIDEDAEKRLNIALNKIEGKWDYSLLEEALAIVSDADTLELSGFNEQDLISVMADHAEFDDDFDAFVDKFTARKGNDFLVFRSPDVAFSVPKPAYDELVQSLYRAVGISDSAASAEFFRLVGLG